ncbi:hypothetical protein KIW84_061826 [Lathyrus oleraceus]|uniref:Uncharacterized protein n=1 Tax=Pisum sativum TaxID=3888 RepID=A0A9D5A7G1_PEA|nr:hypothetical protein KIW84_061826 [Pisum sativum]
MIVMDAKGDRIQVLIRSDHTVKWKQLLKEDMTCVINNDIIGVVHEINNYQSKSDGKKIVVSLKLRDLGYKVEIYVRGGDAKYRFVFWDNGCANIIGKIAEEMCKSMLEDGEDDPMVYPDELGSLLNKKVAFRVKVQPNFSQTSIHKLDTNESFYTHIVNDYINCENQSKPQSPKVVPSEINPQLSSNHSMYACGENEHDFNSDVTLVKVNSLVSRDVDLDSDILGATQYSGTKLPKKVKIEPSN